MWIRCQAEGTFLNADDFRRLAVLISQDSKEWGVYATPRVGADAVLLCSYTSESAARNHLERLGRRLCGEDNSVKVVDKK